MAIIKSYSFPEGEIRGDMFYIQHGTECFTVIDCYLKDNTEEDKERSKSIISEIKEKSKHRIRRFISTHPDNDHILGLENLHDQWKIINFYAVDNQIPSDDNNSSLSQYIELKNSKAFYALKKGISRKWLNDGNDERESSGISILWPDVTNEKFKKVLEGVANGDNHHNNISPIIRYSKENEPSFIWMGDMEIDMQTEFFENFGSSIQETTVLFAPHHGRESGKVPDELLKALNPQIIVIGNAPSRHLNYYDPDKTITQNAAGDIVFESESGWLHIFTKNNISNPPKELTNKNKQKPGLFYIGSLSV